MLSPLIWIPTIGAIVLALLPQSVNGARVRQVAMGFMAAAFAWSLVVLTQFDVHNPGIQLVENIDWLKDLGLTYSLGIDGLSILLVVLNALLMIVAVQCSDVGLSRPRFYYALLMLINTGVAGAFVSQNMLLFFLFYELELIPLYLLIGIWGGARRGYAATKFLIYTAVSGILILASFLGLVWLSGTGSFDYNATMAADLPMKLQLLLLAGFVIGFGIKIPLFPFHTWLPDAHVEASTPVSILLAGVLLKLGTYGLLRFAMGLFPEAWSLVAPYLAWWAVVSVLFGTFSAIAQTDMKKMVAYSSVGHMGFVLLASAASTSLSLVGTVFQMVSHGLISGLLFVLVGVVYKKTKTRDINVLRGLFCPERGLPIIGSLMVLGVMASAGLPGMVGFVSEFLIFRGSFSPFPAQTLLCMVGTGLTAVYFLLLVNKTFFGRLPKEFGNLPSVNWPEHLPGFVLAGLIVIFGLQPTLLVRWIENSSVTMMASFPQQPHKVPEGATIYPQFEPTASDQALVAPEIAPS
ncbi:NADH-quinone oxidoreductase subunit M [filamentous cyanobacterium LEGE 11480]|uniref:NADH-quinone oxidoreductase subunit M n=1 Tax=Romeriopsis navalis LEGE 11480 TaxID=2777977 RepID=A0A928Z2M6_9CYAN|nr:NADH-quinone oxidoreductase subunit M [Romeriopsis navalis]MBE9028293.1 NADH-quinone oxidoreductase subunit M [Romeriopsis navalis LEGE 11480]